MAPLTTTPLAPLLAGMTLLAGAVAPSAPAPEVQFKDSEHKKVGKLMGACIEAYVEREGRREAEAELGDYLEKKWAKAAGDRGPLALTEDLSEALWYAVDYSKARVRKGKVEDMEVPITYHGDHVAVNAVSTPKKYTGKEKLPLVICVPDEGEAPEAHLDEHWMDEGLRESAILVALDMPKTTETWGTLGTPGDPEQVGGRTVLLMTYAELRRSYALDFDRVYLAGRGAGVAAAMVMADAAPDRFAGLIGRTGDAAEIAPDNLGNLPMFFAGAGSRAEAYAAAAKEAGYADVALSPDGGLAEAMAWMGETVRRSNPEKVVLRPGEMFTKAYWLEVPRQEYGPGARVVAACDRASNTVTIETEGVGAFDVTLYFNDVLLDLEQPVKVVCNGAETVASVPRNFNDMMNLVYKGRNEPGKLYTASREYTVPASASEE